MAKSKLTQFATAKAMLSPLCVGEKLTTEQLAGKKIIIKDADIVEYTETNPKTKEPEPVHFVVVAVCDEKGNKLGYYQGGTALTEMFYDIIVDEEMMSELHKDGLNIILTPKKTRGGNNFTAVEIWE